MNQRNMGGKKTVEQETYKEESIINFITYLHRLENSLKENLENCHACLNAARMKQKHLWSIREKITNTTQEIFGKKCATS